MKSRLLKTLYENRHLSNSEAFLKFENALSEYATVASEDDIPSLCHILDDNTEDEEVLFGIVHLLEMFSSENAFKLLLVGLNSIASKSPRWTKIILYRCLNDAPSHKMLKTAFQNTSENNIVDLIAVLKVIQTENPSRFGVKIQELFN